MRRPALTLLSILLLLALCMQASASMEPRARVLLFTKTTGWRHDSIPTAVAALQRLGAQDGMQVDHSENAGDFNAKNLARYQAVVFASTTLDVLDAEQQAAMEGFLRAGGGFMGIHAAADTEYDWPWYGELVGAWFKSHPQGLQTTRVLLEYKDAEGEDVDAPKDWTVTDELYNYRSNPRGHVQVLATVQETDYEGGTMGADHPIAWCHAFDGGRAWYTGLGHEIKLYADPVFLGQLRRGLRYAAGISTGC
ncbi:MAG: ThuA domain-containing protein [Pseudoxanthomonas sp.]